MTEPQPPEEPQQPAEPPAQPPPAPAAPAAPPTTPGSDQFFVSRMGSEDGPFTFMDLQMQVRAGTLKSDSLVRKGAGTWFAAKEVPALYSDKQWLVGLLLSILVGSLGVDRMYIGQVGLGILKLLTCGGFGVWYLIDIVLFATNKVTDSRGLQLSK